MTSDKWESLPPVTETRPINCTDQNWREKVGAILRTGQAATLHQPTMTREQIDDFARINGCSWRFKNGFDVEMTPIRFQLIDIDHPSLAGIRQRLQGGIDPSVGECFYHDCENLAQEFKGRYHFRFVPSPSPGSSEGRVYITPL